jgi:hypothetical protein
LQSELPEAMSSRRKIKAGPSCESQEERRSLAMNLKQSEMRMSPGHSHRHFSSQNDIGTQSMCETKNRLLRYSRLWGWLEKK